MAIMGKESCCSKRQNTRLLLLLLLFRYKKNNVNIMNKFSDKTIEELGYYVYSLTDP